MIPEDKEIMRQEKYHVQHDYVTNVTHLFLRAVGMTNLTDAINTLFLPSEHIYFVKCQRTTCKARGRPSLDSPRGTVVPGISMALKI